LKSEKIKKRRDWKTSPFNILRGLSAVNNACKCCIIAVTTTSKVSCRVRCCNNRVLEAVCISRRITEDINLICVSTTSIEAVRNIAYIIRNSDYMRCTVC
jgi:hypothetical protein